MNNYKISGLALAATIVAAIAFPLQQSSEQVKLDSIPENANQEPRYERISDNSNTIPERRSETIKSDNQTPESLNGASPENLSLLKLRNSHQYFYEKRRQKALENGETLPLYQSKEEMKQRSQIVVAERLKEVLTKRVKAH